MEARFVRQKGMAEMHTQRVAALALIVVMVIGIPVSCGNAAAGKIVGTWAVADGSVSYTFEKDGTGRFSSFGFVDVGMTYTVKDNELRVKSVIHEIPIEDVFLFRIGDGELRLIDIDGKEIILTKRKR